MRSNKGLDYDECGATGCSPDWAGELLLSGPFGFGRKASAYAAQRKAAEIIADKAAPSLLERAWSGIRGLFNKPRSRLITGSAGAAANRVRVAEQLAQSLPASCKGVLNCVPFARALGEKLAEAGIPFKIIKVESKTPRMSSDLVGGGKAITENGVHWAIEVDRVVFDNLLTHGVEREAWEAALQSPSAA